MATANVSSLASYPQPTAELSQRVALYGRVSTRDKGQEVQNQLRQFGEFAVQSGWTIVAECNTATVRRAYAAEALQ